MAVDFCGDLTHGFEQHFATTCGLSQATTLMLFSNSAPYIREILVHKPCCNPEPLADATQRWNRRFIENRLRRSFQFRSMLLNAGAVTDQKTITQIGLMHSQRR